MAKIVVYLQNKDIENFIDILEEGGDHHVSWSPVCAKDYIIQTILTPKEFDVLRLNYVDPETLPILPNK